MNELPPPTLNEAEENEAGGGGRIGCNASPPPYTVELLLWPWIAPAADSVRSDLGNFKSDLIVDLRIIIAIESE